MKLFLLRGFFWTASVVFVFRFWADLGSALPTRSGKGAALVSDTASARRRLCVGSSRKWVEVTASCVDCVDVTNLPCLAIGKCSNNILAMQSIKWKTKEIRQRIALLPNFASETTLKTNVKCYVWICSNTVNLIFVSSFFTVWWYHPPGQVKDHLLFLFVTNKNRKKTSPFLLFWFFVYANCVNEF